MYRSLIVQDLLYYFINFCDYTEFFKSKLLLEIIIIIMSADPIIQLWPYMSQDLQTRLLGVHQRHNKLSVKKVIGSLRGGSDIIAQTLRIIGETSQTPAKSDSSTPALESAVIYAKVAKMRPKMKCSPYVKHTCEVLLEKCKAADPLERKGVPLSCEDFFLTLIEAGPSPLLLQWQEDGLDATRIRKIFAKVKSELGAEDKILKCESNVHGAVTKTLISSAGTHGSDLDHSTGELSSLSLSDDDVDIFISYGREQNTTPLAYQLKNDLERVGFKVWMDLTDISSGSDWHSAIGVGLRKCRALVVIITHKYIRSKYCRNELFMADSLQKDVFPIFLEDVTFDSPEDAGVQYAISSINWVMMTPGKLAYSEAFKHLLDGMIKKGITPSSSTSSLISTGSIKPQVTKGADENYSLSEVHKEEEKWYHKI